MARLIAEWKQAKVQADTKMQIDSVSKAHGSPISVLMMIVVAWKIARRALLTASDSISHSHESELLAALLNWEKRRVLFGACVL